MKRKFTKYLPIVVSSLLTISLASTAIGATVSGQPTYPDNQRQYLAGLIADPNASQDLKDWANESLYLENLKATGTPGEVAWAESQLLIQYGTSSSNDSNTTTTKQEAQPVASNGMLDVKRTHILLPQVESKKAKDDKSSSFDIFDIDQMEHLLYVSDRTNKGIDIFDVSTPSAKYLRTIDLGIAPNGLQIVKNVNKLFAATNDSNVVVINLDPSSSSYQTVVNKINTGGKKRADEMDYDPKENKLYVANGDDEFISVIDPVKEMIIKKLENLGALEQPRYNPADGMMYVTGADENVIIKIDPVKDEVVKKYDIGAKCGPKGIDINPKTNQGIVNCGEQLSFVWDFNTGKLMETFNQVGAGDVVKYDATTDTFFVTGSKFKAGSRIGLFDGSTLKFIGNVAAGMNAHNIGFDQTNKIVYTENDNAGQFGVDSFPLPKR